ncbi:MAG: DNA polymerase III subunit gamma/tau [Cytophagaceae bacterium]
MDNFVVSARKYRPATFDTVVGQSHITTTLKNAIKNNHLAQAFLFCGPRGVGKTTNARILAKTINCHNITEDVEACNECESCVSFNKSSSFNIHELDAASNNSVDDIRNLVDQVRYPPQAGKYKIYIIDEVHMLSNAAFNAFLKTLEEPPSYAIFILATTEKHKIIPTILSRCQIFDFNRIQVKDIAGHLSQIAEKEKITAEPEALHLIAQKADGALRDALSIFDLIVTFSSNNTVTYKTTIENLHILDYDYYFKITDQLHAQDVSSALLTFDEIIREGFDGHNFIVGLCEHIRNLMVCKDTATLKLLEVSDDVKKKYASQAASIPVSYLMSALSIGSQCDIQYKSSKNHRLHVELALMKMAYLNAALQLSTQSTPEGEVKKKPDSAVASVSSAAAVAAPVAPPKIVDKGPKSTMKIPSLHDLKTNISKPKATNTKEIPENTGLAKANEKFTLDDLKSLWNTFGKTFKDKGLKNEYIVMDREIGLDENYNIIVRLDNILQLDILNSFKTDLLDFLRKNLCNGSIMIESHIAPNEEKKMIYTDKDKYRHLVEKYPILDEMRRRLGLEIEF